MEQLILGAAVFVTTWTFSRVYTSVFYHRSLAHKVISLRPGLKRWVLATGNWMTRIDPVGWVAVHRLHHANADQAADPHSPANVGVMGMAMAQLNSYWGGPMSHPSQGWAVSTFGPRGQFRL